MHSNDKSNWAEGFKDALHASPPVVTQTRDGDVVHVSRDAQRTGKGLAVAAKGAKKRIKPNTKEQRRGRNPHVETGHCQARSAQRAANAGVKDTGLDKI
jgi:hypothetical protein